MYILSSITHPYAVQDVYDLLSFVEHELIF